MALTYFVNHAIWVMNPQKKRDTAGKKSCEMSRCGMVQAEEKRQPLFYSSTSRT